MDHPFTADERRLIELWERHMSCEFAERDAAATVATITGGTSSPRCRPTRRSPRSAGPSARGG